MHRRFPARGAALCSLLMIGALSQAHAADNTGLGFAFEADIKFDGDDFVPDVGFKDATGPTVEIGWRWIALSYTNLDYETKLVALSSTRAASD